jgi:DNA polymerase-3 subunit gamma/tau
VCQACTEIDADRYLDYIELDAASNGGKDEIRDLIERAAYKPGIGRFKVFMIDEAHQLSKDAFNALLKTLEEPPEYLKFVLATTDPEKILPTVLSRCLQFNLRPMAPATVRDHLQQVLAAEGVAADAGSLRLLARAARGSMRDGLSLTDQAIAYGGGELSEAVVRTMLGSVDRSHARALVQALAQRDGAAVLATVDGLRSLGLSAAGLLEEMALLLQQMAVQQAVPGALDEDDPDTVDARHLAGALAADETQLLYSMVVHGREELGLLSDEYGALTMVLLRFLAFPPPGGAAAVRPAEPAREPREARAAPLRSPAPPAITLPVSLPVIPPPSAAQRVAEPAAPPFAPSADAALGDRWYAIVKRLCDSGAVSALARELAMQGGLRSIDSSTTPPTWRLVVERDTLRTPALRDKLVAAVATELGQPLQLELEAGTPEDTPTKRDAAERQRRQAAAEASIQGDTVVRELLAQFKTARIVPGSIKPL